MHKISNKTINIITNTIENWREELTADSLAIEKLKIKIDILHGD